MSRIVISDGGMIGLCAAVFGGVVMNVGRQPADEFAILSLSA